MQLVDIPVLPHVKSLLVSLHGSGPLQANENNLLGREIENFLQTFSQLELFPVKLIGDTVSVVVSNRVAAYYKHYQRAFDLGCFFEKQFHLALFMYVEAQMEAGVPQEQAIRNFYERHKIDTECYDTISARMSIMRMRRKTVAEA